jgi:hypothetical protein
MSGGSGVVLRQLPPGWFLGVPRNNETERGAVDDDRYCPRLP